MTKPLFPWSVPLAIADVPAEGVHRDLAAGPAEMAALAEVAQVNAITSLKASLDVVPEGSDRFRVSGKVRGQVTQTCVVSLEPVENEIDEEVDVVFAPAREAEAARTHLAAEQDGDGSADDPPEPIRGAAIDLGEIAAEFFVLGIDPYPRKPGATFDAIHTPPDPADHPFAALAGLKASADKPASGAPKAAGKPKRPT